MTVRLLRGATKIHSTAQAALALLAVETAAKLAEIIGSCRTGTKPCSAAHFSERRYLMQTNALYARDIDLQAGHLVKKLRKYPRHYTHR